MFRLRQSNHGAPVTPPTGRGAENKMGLGTGGWGESGQGRSNEVKGVTWERAGSELGEPYWGGDGRGEGRWGGRGFRGGGKGGGAGDRDHDRRHAHHQQQQEHLELDTCSRYMFVCMMQGGLKGDGGSAGGGGSSSGAGGAGGGGELLGSPGMMSAARRHELKRLGTNLSSASFNSGYSGTAFSSGGGGGAGLIGSGRAIGASHAPITRQGYLYKKGKSGLKNWQKRWFVLEGSKLIW